MRRLRLGTLMLLVVIAALVVALVRERTRSARLEKQVPKYTVSWPANAKTRGIAIGGSRPAGVKASEKKDGAS